jgi:hypothetical protein
VEFEQNALVKAVDRALVEQAREAVELRLSTPGGRFQVRWGVTGEESDYLGPVIIWHDWRIPFEDNGPYVFMLTFEWLRPLDIPPFWKGADEVSVMHKKIVKIRD